ncbi:MAG: zinc ribbon domain-containing protein [Anaerolineae bacterium]
MSGTGLSRLFEVQGYRYAFVSCTNCGYTEVHDSAFWRGRMTWEPSWRFFSLTDPPENRWMSRLRRL